MGVPGLWDIIRPAGQSHSLPHLATISGFEANRSGLRGYRVGIDASIWFFHANGGREGENPELRTLFFKCVNLMTSPFLPLFVFDGPKRPSVKRGKKVKGEAHWLTNGTKRIVEAFGFEWRTAPGEAEAELAYLNRIGVIDAVLSDDVDNFLFGARTVIRNPSQTLTGNRTHLALDSTGKPSKTHTFVFTSTVIQDHPSIQLTHGGLILIGLLSGGDYHSAGLPRCGPKFAHGLAKCGFGDSLLDAARTLPRSELPAFLKIWREELREELRTNSRGHVGRKNPSLAASVPESFPNIEIVLSYTNPITSETEHTGRNAIKITWQKEPNLGKLAGLCEQYFEWGYKERIIKRFRRFMWPAFICRILRRAALDNEAKQKLGGPPSTPKKGKNGENPIGTPSKMIAKHFSKLNMADNDTDDDDEDTNERLIVKIHSSREHQSTDGILEYRVEISPVQLVRLTARGILGTRAPLTDDDDDEEEEEGDDNGGRKKAKTKNPPPHPESHLRVWMPASMVRLAEPHLVAEYEAVLQRKAAKKASKGRATAKNSIVEDQEGESGLDTTSTLRAAPLKKISKARANTVANDATTTAELVADTNIKDFFAVSKASATLKDKAGVSTSWSSVVKEKPCHASRSSSGDNVLPVVSWSSVKSSTSGRYEISESDDDQPARAPPSKKPAPPQSFPVALKDKRVTSDDVGMGPARKLQPFPMSLADDTASSASACSTPSASTKARRTSSLTSDSDRNQCIKKSPRKSMEHNSPRKAAALRRDEEDIEDSFQPTSPSLRPLKVLPHSTKYTSNAKVIEISSDSDAPPSRSKLPPLMLAKRKAQRKNVGLSNGHILDKPKIPLKTSNINSAVECSIVDLT